MTTATKTNTRSAVINTALALLSTNAVRLHKDAQLPTVAFRDRASTEARYNVDGENFNSLVKAIYDRKTNFSSEMSVSITGLLALAIALTGRHADINTSDVQNNASASDAWFNEAGFDEDTTNLIEYAYYPWTKHTNDTTPSEAAAMNYQRRIRTNAEGISDNQTAYRKLAQQILMNLRNNDGTFQPAREDRRAVERSN